MQLLLVIVALAKRGARGWAWLDAGDHLFVIAPRVPNGTLIGLDPIPRMVEIARERASKDSEWSSHRVP